MSVENLQETSHPPHIVHWKMTSRVPSVISTRSSKSELATITRPPPEWLWNLYSS